MQRALGLLGRRRLAALAAGSAAVAASALYARSECLSIELDVSTAGKLAQLLSAQMESGTEASLAGASTNEIIEELRKRLLLKMNTAFVFAKPHANTPAVRAVIEDKFAEKGIRVLSEGDVSGEEIDSNGYIDQHYYAIAEKSTLTSGNGLPVHGLPVHAECTTPAPAPSPSPSPSPSPRQGPARQRGQVQGHLRRGLVQGRRRGPRVQRPRVQEEVRTSDQS